MVLLTRVLLQMIYSIIKNLLPHLKINDSLISTYAMDTIQHKMKVILDNLFNVGLKAQDSKE